MEGKWGGKKNGKTHHTDANGSYFTITLTRKGSPFPAGLARREMAEWGSWRLAGESHCDEDAGQSMSDAGPSTEASSSGSVVAPEEADVLLLGAG